MSDMFNPDGISTEHVMDAQFFAWLDDKARDWTATITVHGANREFLMAVRARDLGDGTWRLEPDPVVPPPALLDALREIAARDAADS